MMYTIGQACRTRVVLSLRNRYTTPREAERMMSTEPKEADTPFSLSATLQNIELAEIPVSFKHTSVCFAFVVYIVLQG